MTTIVSTRLASGQISDISHYNNLRADVLAHTHAAGEGGVINHGDLTDGVISGTYLDHDALNTHVQGAGTSPTPDEGGGDYGVHGLPAEAYIAGSLGSQLLVQYGTGQTDNITVVGSYGSDPVRYHYDQYTTVTFPTAFGGAPSVVIMANVDQSVRIAVQNITTTTFTARVGYAYDDYNDTQEDTHFSWIAIGPKP